MAVVDPEPELPGSLMASGVSKDQVWDAAPPGVATEYSFSSFEASGGLTVRGSWPINMTAFRISLFHDMSNRYGMVQEEGNVHYAASRLIPERVESSAQHI